MIRTAAGLSLMAGLTGCQASEGASFAAMPPSVAPPNVVIVFADDQGFGDLSCYGHPTIHTPRIDAMAAEGAKLTQFYVAAPVCSPSRAALLTGCYPKRVGMHRGVVFPENDCGLAPEEETLAEVLRARGYATGCFGKWHLGHRPGLMPTDQGFDVFQGVPYSNDMSQFHRDPSTDYRWRLPYMDGASVVEWEADQRGFTGRQTSDAIRFIEDASRAGQPFFAYVPYSMPHIPLYASEERSGTSLRGLYGDVIEEIDDSVGRILDALKSAGVDDNTLVLFTSDNGPWLPYRLKGGSAGLLRGGKGTTWEGGLRVPCVVRWPGRVAPGRVIHDVCTAMDVLPTTAAMVGAALPEKEIDGQSLLGLLTGPSNDPAAALPVRPFLYYGRKGELAAIRRGPWKLVLEGSELYDVEQDASETIDASDQHPALVKELDALALAMDAEITRDARPRGAVSEILFDPKRP